MATQHVFEVFENDEIERSESDKRIYRALKLKNGLKIILISDFDTEKASAALDVHIGYMKDPRDIPGLAHFCEHMLFMGSKKYEKENEFFKFLSEHGGTSNAITSKENTIYYFDVTSENILGAIDRFAQFFLCPLFTKSAIEREINAVNSEHENHLKSDGSRLWMLIDSLGNAEHAYAKFGAGNRDTLCTIPRSKGVDVRKQLIEFHSKYYSSNIMTLAVYGKESLNELEEMVVPLFSAVENKSIDVPFWTESPYGLEHIKKIFYAVPVNDIRTMLVTWTIPDLTDWHASKPGRILGHLIEHEGNGSLFSKLKQKGWVNSLSGGQSAGAKGFMFFNINFELSLEGLENIDNIVQMMFQYIEMLKTNGPKKWIFEECKQISDIRFKYQNKGHPIDHTYTLAKRMQTFHLTKALSSPCLLKEYRPDLITMLLSKLIPETIRIGVISKKFADLVDQKEKWFGTKYKLEDIADEAIQKWKNCGLSEDLHLPPRNEFIPTCIDIVTREKNNSPMPEVIKDTGLTRLWFKQDDTFLHPKACLTFMISSPLVYMDPLNCNMAYLFTKLFEDNLNEYAYNAGLAGLSYSLTNTRVGFLLTVEGYHDKQPMFLRKILEELSEFNVDEKRFGIYKEKYMRGLRNFDNKEPHQHAIYYANHLMAELEWTITELLHSAADMTVDKLQEFIPRVLSNLSIEAFMYGNVTKKQSRELMNMTENILTKKCGTRELFASQCKRYREVQIPDGCYYLYQAENNVHRSNSVCIYYQCGLQDTLSSVLLKLFLNIIDEPCFDILRTKEQLGYTVYSCFREACGVQGLEIVIQSDKPSQYLNDRAEAFLYHMDNVIRDMSEEEYSHYVEALVNDILEKPKNIYEQDAEYWCEISSNTYNFDRDNIEVACLKTIKKDDLIKFYQEFIAIDATYRHKLAIHVCSSLSEELKADELSANDTDLLPLPPKIPEPILVEDIAEFKRCTGLYPLPKPFIKIVKVAE